jgi:hypothetical protein
VYGYIGAPLQGKSFGKAMSAVMDDLEPFYSIIEQLALIDDKKWHINSSTIILNCYIIVNHVSAFDIASSCGHNKVIHRLCYVCCSILALYFMRSFILF